VVALACGLAIILSSDALGLFLVRPWGWLNVAILSGIVGWYAYDAAQGERLVSGPPIRPSRRFLRKVALLASVAAGLAAAGLAFYQAPQTADDSQTAALIPRDAIAPLFAFIGAVLAAFGWLYTTFEKEKADRAAHTLQAIRDQLYGEPVSSAYALMSGMVVKLRTDHGLVRKDTFPLALMETKVDEFSNLRDIGKHKGRTLRDLVIDTFNAMNQLALGVRAGQFDLRTIESVLRPRFVRNAYIFAPFIREEVVDPASAESPPRATDRAWEHFLWLVQCLSKDESIDEIELKQMVLPPRPRS
jgi:hypothetical protein